MRESETLHTGDVQRHKGTIKYTGHSELRMR